ncbi:MAG: Uma2 family endonuclease [Bacteroidota bacterium]
MKATLNTCTIIEVLSDSTAQKDRGEKWQGYRKIQSLQEYVLIARDEIFVEVFRKKMENETIAWLNEHYDADDQSVSIAGQTILLSEIYRKVDFGLEE